MYIAHTFISQTRPWLPRGIEGGGTIDFRDGQKPYSPLLALFTTEGSEIRLVIIEHLVPTLAAPSAVLHQDEATKKHEPVASSP